MKSKSELSELFKLFQENIKKKDTFSVGKKYLLEFRQELLDIYQYIFNKCKPEDYSKMPLTTDKTIAYYLYHLNRIEDITSNTLILNTPQIFFNNNYVNTLNSPIITTGNELTRDELIPFSQKLNLEVLKNYCLDIFTNTNQLIENIDFSQAKTKVSLDRKNNLLNLKTVSSDKNAIWLVDYWCGKDYLGLLLMPFSRHQLMHLLGCLRIINKIYNK